MNVNEACELLNIPSDFLEIDDYTLKKTYLSKQYRKSALLSHPDKNGSTESFQKVKTAYDFLMEYITPDENGEMEEMVELIDKIFLICEKQMIKWLESIEPRKFKVASNILNKFRHVFRLSDEFYTSLSELKKEIIKIEPLLNDVMHDMIYSLWKDEKQYLIPLWHHELVYDHFGIDLIIQIEPVTDLWIDSENNIHQIMEIPLTEIFTMSMQKLELEVWFGNKKMYLSPTELLLKREQTYTWKNEGISKIKDNIYDSTERGDLVLDLVIY